MKLGRFISASLVAGAASFAVSMAIGFGTMGLYDPASGLWRAAMTPNWIAGMAGTHLAFGVIYTLGYDFVHRALGNMKERVKKGLKFGVLAWLLKDVSGSIISYATMPLPSALPLVWMTEGLLASLLMGIIIAQMHK